MTNLPEDLEQLLEAERDIDVPAPAQRQRMLARLQPLLIVPVAVAAGASTAATAADAGSATIGGFLKGKIAAAIVSSALVGGAVGASGHAYLASPTPSSTASTVVKVAPPPPSVPSAAPVPAATTPDAPMASTSAAPSPSHSAARQDRSPPVGSLRAERLLLEAASAALVRGDPDSAILTLRKHAQRFPNGALAAEREALMTRALAASRKSQ
jgi:hypothetical protein